MQNLPITPTTQPATPAQASGPADNNTTQAAESFDSVLARQRTNADEPKPGTDTRDKGHPTSSSPGPAPTNNAVAAAGNEPETPVTNAANMLPGDMLAALLPTTANAKNVAAHKKPAPLAPATDGVSTLPSDMLAALLSTSAAAQPDTGAATQQPVAVGIQGDTLQQPVAADAQNDALQQPVAAGVQNDTQQQPVAAGVQGDTWQQPVAVGIQGDTRQLAGAQGGARQQLIATDARSSAQQSASAGKSIVEQAASSLFRAQGNNMPPVADTNAAQGKTFSNVLEALGKDAANTALSASTAQISTQAALPDAIILASQAQSNTAPVVASSNGSAQAVVNTPVTHEAWGAEFNQKITWLATQHEQTAELHLNPPHLGPMDVVLNISGDQATALFTSPHAAVRDAVEQALPKLREMLADNGITLGNATVSDQSPKEQHAWLADKQAHRNGGLPGETGDAVPAISTAWPARRHQGMVDTFA